METVILIALAILIGLGIVSVFGVVMSLRKSGKESKRPALTRTPQGSLHDTGAVTSWAAVAFTGSTGSGDCGASSSSGPSGGGDCGGSF